MRRAGGLVLLAALAAGCSTGSIDDLPTAAGGEPTVRTDASLVPGSAVPLTRPPDGSYAAGGAVPPPQPAPDNHAVQDPAPRPGPPQPAPIQVPATPLEAFRGLEQRCSIDVSLLNRGRDGPYPPVEPDRFSGAVLVRDLPGGQSLIEDGRGTRLVLDWRATGRLLPGSGRAGDPMPEPYRSSCPDAVAAG